MEFSSQANTHHHDTHALPPAPIQEAYLYYNKVRRAELEQDNGILDFDRGLSEQQRKTWLPAGCISASTIENACKEYQKAALLTVNAEIPSQSKFNDVTIYEHKEIPGLQVAPRILPSDTQILFTSQLMHRDLADPKHKINLEADYHIPYPPAEQQDLLTSDVAPLNSKASGAQVHNSVLRSFFSYPQSSQTQLLHPKGVASDKKPLNMAQFLTKKLRWLTLGDQYDWPTRSYGKTMAPFPSDLSRLVMGLFPHIRPESGVVLIYSGKDYMPVHRDVSELCERALASFSLGCDGIFVIAKDQEDSDAEALTGGKEDDAHHHIEPKRRPDKTVAIRVRSGDCILLSGEARWAWHAMPRTIAGTCPEPLAKWPVGTPGATEEEKKAYAKWKGYMSGKRINISCRQVWD